MYERILVPLDGSRASNRAMRHARAIAGEFGSRVLLLRVAERVNPAVVGDIAAMSASVTQVAVEAAEAETRHNVGQSRRQLNSHRRRLERAGVSAEVIVTTGAPADAIVRAARRNKVDLIVMSTRGHGGIRRAILGSVADAVVRADVAPVLLVKQ